MRQIKEILRLKHELQLSVRDIARGCAVPASTVGDYLQRAQAVGLAWPLPEEWTQEQILERLLGAATLSPTRQDSEDGPQTQDQPGEPPADQEPKDQLAVFGDTLLTALAEAGKPVACKVSTQEVASLFQNFSVNSAGRSMAILAGRYPKQFIKADTEQWHGWQILG